jgi:hypothetical protein
MPPKPRNYWTHLQPRSLPHALEAGIDRAREKLNKSVEQIAEQTGETSQWTVYKWVQSGRIPANLIRPFEIACGADYVTRWLAASAGKLLIDVPTGRRLKESDVVAMHNGFGAALQLLTDFYAGKATAGDTLEAMQNHLEAVAWHHHNVRQHGTPELDFNASTNP